MFVSIIIPALNEEKYLPRLLKSIKDQSFTQYEVIIADAGSTDETLTIAAEFGTTVVKGGLPGPGRNSGAKIAKGDFLLFLDSDVILPDHFLESAFNEIEKKFYDMATCEMHPDSGLDIDKAIYNSFSLIMKMNSLSNPMAAGSCIFITKRLFNRIGGFNEEITLAEDFDLVKRASFFRPLFILKSTTLTISVRRLEKEGRLQFIKKSIIVGFYRTFFGEIKDDRFNYEFADFNAKDEDLLATRLRRLDNFIIKAEKLYKNRVVSMHHRKKLIKILIERRLRKLKKQLIRLFKI